jgi:site-specific recombinase XerD
MEGTLIERARVSWVRQGVEAPIVQQLAGHKSIVTTQLYIGRMSKADTTTRVARAFTAIYGRAI